MSERGFVAMARGVLDHPIVGARKPYDPCIAWLWLVCEAAWKPRTYRAGVAVVQLKRGQLAHSTRFMAKAWGWSEPRVRRFLRRLKTGAGTGAMIDAATDAGITVISICNYDRHQRGGGESDAVIDALTDAATDAGATQQRRRKEESNHLTIDDAEDGSRIPKWKSTDEYKLAKQIAGIAGQSDEFEFSGWNGATQRVQTWLNKEGWAPELILASVREQAAKKRDGPVRSIKYFEQGIATAIARQNSPVPTIEFTTSRYTEPSNGNRGNILPAADRIIESVRAFDKPAPTGLCGDQGTSPIRLLSQGGRQ